MARPDYHANQSPSDITIRGNHITRPAAWKGVWTVKNLFETKHVRRMLVEGNVFENNWADAQAGFAFVLKSENQNGDTPWTQSTDITIRYNRIRNTGNVFNLAANPSGLPAISAGRMVITDNLIENVNGSPYIGDGHTMQLLGGLYDIVFMHNTVLSANGGRLRRSCSARSRPCSASSSTPTCSTTAPMASRVAARRRAPRR